jgi:hypothetical protein
MEDHSVSLIYHCMNDHSLKMLNMVITIIKIITIIQIKSILHQTAKTLNSGIVMDAELFKNMN